MLESTSGGWPHGQPIAALDAGKPRSNAYSDQPLNRVQLEAEGCPTQAFAWVGSFSRVRRTPNPRHRTARNLTPNLPRRTLRALRRVQHAEGIAAVGPDQDQSVFPLGHSS